MLQIAAVILGLGVPLVLILMALLWQEPEQPAPPAEEPDSFDLELYGRWPPADHRSVKL